MKFHFSFHKCITQYTGRTLSRALNSVYLKRTGHNYRHFASLKSDFIEKSPNLKMASLNNHFIAIDELEKISGEENTYSLFIRDPRDLLVSGYFYHKKGLEAWTKVKNPAEKDYRIVNGYIPEQLVKTGASLYEYLNQCDLDEGLLIELAFRKHHFQSLDNWLAYRDPRILMIDYMEVMQNEGKAFDKLAVHHGFNFVERKALAYFVNKYKVSNVKSSVHIRNPEPGQWKKTLTPACLEALDAQFPELISRYDLFTGQSPATP